jgi:hypothetical protein
MCVVGTVLLFQKYIIYDREKTGLSIKTEQIKRIYTNSGGLAYTHVNTVL